MRAFDEVNISDDVHGDGDGTMIMFTIDMRGALTKHEARVVAHLTVAERAAPRRQSVNAIKYAEKPGPNAAKRCRPLAAARTARSSTNIEVTEDMLP